VCAMKRTRIVISGDSETLQDAQQLAQWFSLGATPNVSDTLRRLLRWAVTHPAETEKALGCPLGRPKPQPEPIKQDDSRSTLPAIVIDKEQTCPDTWDWPGVEKP
jgi:hypothetical protein